jgi:peptidoglycan/xylan/chitin deacetylase (PgdA/CDA1 family)
MATIPFVWSNDDITAGGAVRLTRQLEMIDRLGISGVFFVIPRDNYEKRNIDSDLELMRVIEKSRARGHEYFQHGYIHTPFESGVPETWMLDMAPDVRNQYDVKRLEIEKQHTLEAMLEMIANGAKIWRRAFGTNSVGYRPGWGAFCGNLYRALEQLGFEWCSARIPSPTSWKWNNGKWDEPMNFREGVAAGPSCIGRIIEYPLGGDYAFMVPNEPARIDAMVGLGIQELGYYHERGLPMIVCSHWHGLERNGGTGYAVHEKLLPAILRSGKVQPMNMTQLSAWAKEKPERIVTA